MTYVQLPSADADAACRSWSRQTNEMLRSNVADEQRRTNLKRGHIMSNVNCKRMFVQRAKGSWTSWCIFSVILFGNVWVLLHVYIVLVHCTSFFPSVLMIVYRAASPSFFFQDTAILSGLSCKEEYQPWKWGDTARYYASHTKTTLPTRKSVPRSSRQYGPHEDLLTIVKRRKLKWYRQVSRSPGLA